MMIEIKTIHWKILSITIAFLEAYFLQYRLIETRSSEWSTEKRFNRFFLPHKLLERLKTEMNTRRTQRTEAPSPQSIDNRRTATVINENNGATESTSTESATGTESLFKPISAPILRSFDLVVVQTGRRLWVLVTFQRLGRAILEHWAEIRSPCTTRRNIYNTNNNKHKQHKQTKRTRDVSSRVGYQTQ